MIRLFVFVCFCLLLQAPGNSLHGVEEDSVAQLDMGALRRQVEREEARKLQLLEQAKRERLMLVVMQDATGELLGHYRTLRDLKEKYLAVAVLDSPTVVATIGAADQIKQAQATILKADDPQQVRVALDVTSQAVSNLKTVFVQRKKRERELLATVPAVPVDELRERAIATMNDLKKGLNGRITAEHSTQKLMIRNLGGLKANLMNIDSGIKDIERAGTVARVGEVLAEVGFNKEQLQLIDSELGLKGGRGREIVQAETDRDPVAFRQQALVLMRGMRNDVKKRIKAGYVGSKREIDQLTGLEAKLKRVDTGIIQVEKAGSGEKLSRILVEIQLDLGNIDRLRSGAVHRKKKPRKRVTENEPGINRSPVNKNANVESHGITGADSGRLRFSVPEPATVALEIYLAQENHRKIVMWALVILGALLCSLLLSVRKLHVPK